MNTIYYTSGGCPFCSSVQKATVNPNGTVTLECLGCGAVYEKQIGKGNGGNGFTDLKITGCGGAGYHFNQMSQPYNKRS